MIAFAFKLQLLFSFCLTNRGFSLIRGNIQQAVVGPHWPLWPFRRKVADRDPTETGKFISVPLSTGASCLDGSPYVFSISKRPEDDPTKWTIWTEGGGTCWNETTCMDRANTWLGSSKFDDRRKDPDNCGCLHFNQGGTTQNCTCVRLYSCDGGYFSGHLNGSYTTANGTQLFLRGRRNMEASIELLLKDYGLADASELVVAGTSAGAVSSVLFLDHLANLVPSTLKVSGIPVGGFTINHENLNGQPYFLDSMEMTFEFHHSSNIISSECQAEYPHMPWKCLVVEKAAQYVQTPMFILQSKYDSWQLGNILGLNWGDVHQRHEGVGTLLRNVSSYGYDFMEAFRPVRRMMTTRETKHMAFLTSCICHTDDCNFLLESVPIPCDGNPRTSLPQLIGGWTRAISSDWLWQHKVAKYPRSKIPGVYIDDKPPNYDCCLNTKDPAAYGCLALLHAEDPAFHPFSDLG